MTYAVVLHWFPTRTRLAVIYLALHLDDFTSTTAIMSCEEFTRSTAFGFHLVRIPSLFWQKRASHCPGFREIFFAQFGISGVEVGFCLWERSHLLFTSSRFFVTLNKLNRN